jgi:ribosomal protein S21
MKELKERSAYEKPSVKKRRLKKQRQLENLVK